MSDNASKEAGQEAVQALAPSQCRPWKFHNRSGAGLASAQIESLSGSIESDGQQQPGLVRILEGAEGDQYEVIFGMRRCAACESIGVPFLAKVLAAQTSDQMCARLMHIENEERSDICDLERSRNYRQLLSGGVFESQQELAAELGITQSAVSQCVKASEIFEYPWLASIIEPDMKAVSLRTALSMARALSKSDRQRLMRDRAKRLADHAREQDVPLVVPEVVKSLLSSVGVQDSATAKREVLARVGRRPVAQFIRTKGGGVQLSIEKVALPPEQAENLIGEITERVRAFVDSSHEVQAKP